MTSLVNSVSQGTQVQVQLLEECTQPTTIEKISSAISASFKSLGLIAFAVGVTGFSLTTALALGGAPAMLTLMPTYLAIAGGAAHFLGCLLEELSSRSLVQISTAY